MSMSWKLTTLALEKVKSYGKVLFAVACLHAELTGDSTHKAEPILDIVCSVGSALFGHSVQ